MTEQKDKEAFSEAAVEWFIIKNILGPRPADKPNPHHWDDHSQDLWDQAFGDHYGRIWGDSETLARAESQYRAHVQQEREAEAMEQTRRLEIDARAAQPKQGAYAPAVELPPRDQLTGADGGRRNWRTTSTSRRTDRSPGAEGFEVQ